MLDNDVLKCKITANAHYDPRSAEIIARNSSLNFHQFFYGGWRGGFKFLLELIDEFKYYFYTYLLP